MFDTIHVKPPLLCPNCGAEISSLQTKELSDSMAPLATAAYSVCHSVLTSSHVLPNHNVR